MVAEAVWEFLVDAVRLFSVVKHTTIVMKGGFVV